MTTALMALKKELEECEKWIAELREYEKQAKRLRAAIAALEDTEQVRARVTANNRRMSKMQISIREYLLGRVGATTFSEAQSDCFDRAYRDDPDVTLDVVYNCLRHLIKKKLIIATDIEGTKYLKWHEACATKPDSDAVGVLVKPSSGEDTE